METRELINCLNSPEETERIYAAEDLGYAHESEALEPLLGHLSLEPSRKVREAIFLALERIESPRAPGKIAELFGSGDAFLRNQAVVLLQKKGPSAIPVLMVKMRDPDAGIRKLALDTAAGIGHASTEPIYEMAMRDPDINVLIAALEYLGNQKMSRFRKWVEQVFLTAQEPMVVSAALSTLSKIGDDGSWECIRRRYPSPARVPNWEISWWVRGLGSFGGANEVELFHEILVRHDGRVAGDAIDALEQFEERHGPLPISQAFWQTLQEMLKHPLETGDKLQLLRLLGGFSAPDEIGPFLLKLLGESDPVIKLGAIEGIKRRGQPNLLEAMRQKMKGETNPEIREVLNFQ